MNAIAKTIRNYKTPINDHISSHNRRHMVSEPRRQKHVRAASAFITGGWLILTAAQVPLVSAIDDEPAEIKPLIFENPEVENMKSSAIRDWQHLYTETILAADM